MGNHNKSSQFCFPYKPHLTLVFNIFPEVAYMSYSKVFFKIVVNEVEYVGKRQIVKIEQLATKQDNNNLKHIFCGIYFGQRSARKQFQPNCLEALANLSFI